MLFIAIPGSIFFSDGIVFGTNGSAFQTMDAVKIFDIFLLLQINVHRAIFIAQTAVGAFFQISSDQQTPEAKQPAQVLEQVKQGSVWTEEAAEEPFGQKSASNNDQPDDHSWNNDIGETAEHKNGAEIHIKRTFSEQNEQYSSNQDDIFYNAEFSFIEERHAFTESVLFASKIEQPFLKSSDGANVTAELSADEHGDNSNHQTKHNSHRKEKEHIAGQTGFQNTETDHCIGTEGMSRLINVSDQPCKQIDCQQEKKYLEQESDGL